MAITIRVTQEDIDNMALKLDEFATVLNERERALLTAVLGMAGIPIQEWIERGLEERPTPTPTSLPPLSAGFRAAFRAGVGTRFTIEEDTSSEAEAESTKIRDGWDKTSMM
jgi:hypothetical protein